ncbi:jg1318 [Pararge aegeria aegeria]|uniref:Jg1318 protein n=1 Tax=Pararge aegeria aegeria TaxID=348720 RepID=A0A8S4SPC8_9NEOP|nr:jg1318 [Pararge aegeria aegeria]
MRVHFQDQCEVVAVASYHYSGIATIRRVPNHIVWTSHTAPSDTTPFEATKPITTSSSSTLSSATVAHNSGGCEQVVAGNIRLVDHITNVKDTLFRQRTSSMMPTQYTSERDGEIVRKIKS